MLTILESVDENCVTLSVKDEVKEEPNCLENAILGSTSGREEKYEFEQQIKEEIRDDEAICLDNRRIRGLHYSEDVGNNLEAVKSELISNGKIEIWDEIYFPANMIDTPQCVTCEMRFLKDEELNAHYHINESHKPKRYKCQECVKTFEFVHLLRDHEKLTHSIGSSKSTKLFKCKVCEKAFCHPHSLKEHSMIHTGEKPFSCKQCEETFFSSYALTVHETRHNTPAKSFKSKARKKATDFHGLRRLQKANCLITHKKYDKFLCMFCGDRCDSKVLLIKHLKAHEGLMLYRCLLCNERFPTSKLLGAHQCPANSLEPFNAEESIKAEIAGYSDEEFTKYFSMKKSTFSYVLSLIDTQIRNKRVGKFSLPDELQLQITLWYFSQPAHFKFVHARLNIAHSTALNSVRRVVNALYDLAPSIISWPKKQRLREVEHGFNQMGLPSTIGSLGATYVNTYFYKDTFQEESSEENSPFVILQAVCDHTLKFINCHATKDLTSNNVLMYSDVWKFVNGYNSVKFPNGTFLVGNQTYPCLPRLITPYIGTLTDEQHNFNEKLSPAINTIAKAFHCLKKRFKYLDGVLDIRRDSSEWAPKYMIACCILHNICIMKNDLFDIDFTEVEEFDCNATYHMNQDILEAGMKRRNEICEMLKQS